jgi:hypothetical protein
MRAGEFSPKDRRPHARRGPDRIHASGRGAVASFRRGVLVCYLHSSMTSDSLFSVADARFTEPRSDTAIADGVE